MVRVYCVVRQARYSCRPPWCSVRAKGCAVSDTAPATVNAAVERAVWSACVTEIGALKPGNVSVYADGHGMKAEDFIRSAQHVAAVMGTPGLSVGERVLQSVELTRRAVACNTNLGIILLCAPLAQAALRQDGLPFRESVRTVLLGLDVRDAVLAYDAIRLACPGGLGQSERHDIHSAPTVTLLEAMTEAKDRDRIAYQYASAYEDIFTLGVPCLEDALAYWRSEEWAAVTVYLVFLARFPDTHIQRKFGLEMAEDVCRRAAQVEAELRRCFRPEEAVPLLLRFDAELKQAGLNPGTSADLTVATLLIPRLEAIVRTPGARSSEVGPRFPG